MQLIEFGAIVTGSFMMMMIITRLTEGSWRGSHNLKNMWMSPWSLTSMIAPIFVVLGLVIMVAGVVVALA